MLTGGQREIRKKKGGNDREEGEKERGIVAVQGERL